MAQVSVTINGRGYQISCDDGQEGHLQDLGNYINSRIEELVASVGQIGDARLLVMANLLVADELSDAYSELKEARQASEGVASLMSMEDKLAEGIEILATRIEKIAHSVEQA